MSYFCENISVEKMKFEEFKQFIDIFFKDSDMKEGLIKLKNPIEITENEYRELIKDKYFVEEYRNNDIYIQEFEKPEDDNIFAEMMIAYYKKDNKIFLTDVELWREKRDWI